MDPIVDASGIAEKRAGPTALGIRTRRGYIRSEMLLTLSTSSLRPLLNSKAGGTGISLNDLPAYTRQALGLHGLNLGTDLLAGWGRADLEAFRDLADRARCACLLLIEPKPLPLAGPKSRAGPAAERLIKVIHAAAALGCSAAAAGIKAPDTDPAFESAVERLKRVVEVADQRDINLLVSPQPGLTADPDRVTDLIKRIGGFRVGTLPDFEVASAQDDPQAYLRRLTPYASVVVAATHEFVPVKGRSKARKAPKSEDADAAADDAEDADTAGPPMQHRPYDLAPLVDSIVSVGFDGTLAIDYRGDEDCTLGVVRSRRALESALTKDQ